MFSACYRIVEHWCETWLKIPIEDLQAAISHKIRALGAFEVCSNMMTSTLAQLTGVLLLDAIQFAAIK